jgi:hypothetical protein
MRVAEEGVCGIRGFGNNDGTGVENPRAAEAATILQLKTKRFQTLMFDSIMDASLLPKDGLLSPISLSFIQNSSFISVAHLM